MTEEFPSQTYPMPKSEEAEMSVLCAMMYDSKCIGDVIEIIKAEDFYRHGHQTIFEAILELYEANTPVDIVTLSEKLQGKGKIEEIGGRVYLAGLNEMAYTAQSAGYHADIIHQKAMLRKLITVSLNIIAEAVGEPEDVERVLDEAETQMFSVREFDKKTHFIPVKREFDRQWEHLSELNSNPRDITGVPTGIIELDHLTTGFQPGDFVIVAGRPSTGKTALALDFARFASVGQEKPVPIAFFSLEMSSGQLTQRMIAASALVNAHELRRGRLGALEWNKIADIASTVENAPFYILDTPSLTTLEIRAKARRIKAEQNVRLIIVDYLQLIKAPRGKHSREQEVASISSSMKALAKELEVPVIVLSQLNRGLEMRPKGDRRPRLSDLRDSGALEQDADVVLFVYRPEMYDRENMALRGQAEVILAKQRNGPAGHIRLNFNKESMTFTERTEHNF